MRAHPNHFRTLARWVATSARADGEDEVVDGDDEEQTAGAEVEVVAVVLVAVVMEGSVGNSA